MTNAHHFTTSDLPVAAFLLTKGQPLLATEPDGRRLNFKFPGEAADAARLYMQGASVPARDFYAALRDLKTMIFAGA